MLLIIPLLFSLISLEEIDKLEVNLTTAKIPKILHYVWAGTAAKSELVKNNIKSWKKYCPDWLIVEWNDDTIGELDFEYAK